MKNMLADPAAHDLISWAPVLELATREVFQLMLSEELLPGDYVHSAGPLDMTAMVGLAGQVCGMISVRCSIRAANLMAARMLGMDGYEDRPETWDALGEICNMVAGNFKNKIHNMAEGCMISVPTVVSGMSYQLHPFRKNKRIEAHFSFRNLPLEVAIEVNG